MRRTYLSLCALVLLITTAFQAQDGRSVVNAALKAMGAENLRTIQFSGSGSNAEVGQNTSPKTAWPTVRVKSYIQQIDLAVPASSTPWERQFDLWITPFGFLKGAASNPVTLRSETISGVNYKVVGFVLQNKYRVEG